MGTEKIELSPNANREAGQLNTYKKTIKAGGKVMRIVRDESNMDLCALLGTLRSVAPEVWESSERNLILPQELGDLERPEIMNGLREKIRGLRELKQMLDRDSITREDYSHKKIEVLSRI